MKLYLITRKDLDPGQQAVQLAHALREFTALHPEEDLEWYTTSNTLVLLVIPNEASLEVLLHKAKAFRIAVAPFREPDRKDELTAIALGPQGKRLCRRLPKAFSVESSGGRTPKIEGGAPCQFRHASKLPSKRP